MLLGLDGVEIGLVIVFVTLFAAILSGFPVAFAIGGAGVISFAIIAILDGQGLLIHQAIDTVHRRLRMSLRQVSNLRRYLFLHTRNYRVPLTQYFPKGGKLR